MTAEEKLREPDNCLVIIQGGSRLICPIHGDIGALDGMEGNMGLCFTGTGHYYCFHCIEGLLKKAIPQCEITQPKKA